MLMKMDNAEEQINGDIDQGGVLIVDDSRFAVKILKDILTKENFKVLAEAKNGMEAIELTKEHKPTYIFLDVEMPVMDGVSALPKILEAYPYSYIIMCTAMGQQDIIDKAIKAGARDFVIKPYRKENIVGVMNVATMVASERQSSPSKKGGSLSKSKREEAERTKREQEEAVRIEQERIEAERIKKEKEEAERIEQERIEAERIKREKEEAERIEQERIEAERIKREKEEAERIEQERIEAERIKREKEEAKQREKEEAERIEQEKEEAERIRREQEKDSMSVPDPRKDLSNISRKDIPGEKADVEITALEQKLLQGVSASADFLGIGMRDAGTIQEDCTNRKIYTLTRSHEIIINQNQKLQSWILEMQKNYYYLWDNRFSYGKYRRTDRSKLKNNELIHSIIRYNSSVQEEINLDEIILTGLIQSCYMNSPFATDLRLRKMVEKLYQTIERKLINQSLMNNIKVGEITMSEKGCVKRDKPEGEMTGFSKAIIEQINAKRLK